MELKTRKSDQSEKLPGSVYIVVLALGIDLLGFTVILPLIPSILELYESDEDDSLYVWLQNQVRFFQHFIGASDAFNKVLFGGMLGSMFSVLQFLAAPIIGSLSDVYGRKPVLLLSMIGIAASHAIWMCADTFSIFVLARIIGGISRANVSLTTAIVTDLCSPKTRGKGMALVGIAFAIGFIIGPMIGAIFAVRAEDAGKAFYVMPATFAFTITLLDIFFVYLMLKESLPLRDRAKSIGVGILKAHQFINPVSLFSFGPVQNVSKKDLSLLQDIGLSYFLFLFLYSGLEYSLGFLTHIRFMFTSMEQGKMYLFSGLIMILIQGGVTRRIPPGKEMKIALIGAVIIIPSFIIIGVSRSIAVYYFGLALYAYASATVVPCLTVVVSKLGNADQKGTILGIFRSLGSLARSFGPFVSAFTYWSLGSTMSYCLGSVLLIIPMILIKNLKRKLGDQTFDTKTR